jgi:hypothetical protein
LDNYFFEGPYISGTPQEVLPTQEYEQWQYNQKFVTLLPSRKAIFKPIKGTTPVTAPPPLPSTAPTPVSERSLSLPGLTEEIAPELSPLSTQKVSKGKYRVPKEQEEEEVFDDIKEEPIPEPSFEFLKQPEYQPRNITTAEGPSSEPQTGSPIRVDPPKQKTQPLRHAPPAGFPVTSSFLKPPPPPKVPQTSMAAVTSDKFKFPEPREFDGRKRNAKTWILRLEEYFGA